MPRLTPLMIGQTGLALVDEHGPSGLTLRAVAERLKVTPMALYHHIDGKVGLADLVVRLANSEAPLGELDLPWDEELVTIASWSRTNRLAHPGVNELRTRYNVVPENQPILAGRWVACWQRSGLSDEAAVSAALTSSAAVIGLIVHELEARRRVELSPEQIEELSAEARALLTAEVDYAEIFDLGVRSIITGLHAKLLDGKANGGRGG